MICYLNGGTRSKSYDITQELINAYITNPIFSESDEATSTLVNDLKRKNKKIFITVEKNQKNNLSILKCLARHGFSTREDQGGNIIAEYPPVNKSQKFSSFSDYVVARTR